MRENGNLIWVLIPKYELKLQVLLQTRWRGWYLAAKYTSTLTSWCINTAFLTRIISLISSDFSLYYWSISIDDTLQNRSIRRAVHFLTSFVYRVPLWLHSSQYPGNILHCWWCPFHELLLSLIPQGDFNDKMYILGFWHFTWAKVRRFQFAFCC